MRQRHRSISLRNKIRLSVRLGDVKSSEKLPCPICYWTTCCSERESLQLLHPASSQPLCWNPALVPAAISLCIRGVWDSSETSPSVTPQGRTSGEPPAECFLPSTPICLLICLNSITTVTLPSRCLYWVVQALAWLLFFPGSLVLYLTVDVQQSLLGTISFLYS